MRKNLRGFTLVETILALAIGGLILMGVFIALPALLRNQRDADRKSDVATLISRLKAFQTNNNRGSLPTGGLIGGTVTITGSTVTFGSKTGLTWQDFYGSYFDKDFIDPSSGEVYNWKIMSCTTKASPTVGAECDYKDIADFMKNTTTFNNANFTMYIVTSAKCDGEKAVYSANSRNAAVLYKLEGAGTFCANT